MEKSFCHLDWLADGLPIDDADWEEEDGEDVESRAPGGCLAGLVSFREDLYEEGLLLQLFGRIFDEEGDDEADGGV